MSRSDQSRQEEETTGFNSEDLAKQRHDMSKMLLQMREQMGPIFDAADGMKADLEKRGWSPTASEQIALLWLSAAVAAATGGGA